MQTQWWYGIFIYRCTVVYKSIKAVKNFTKIVKNVTPHKKVSVINTSLYFFQHTHTHTHTHAHAHTYTHAHTTLAAQQHKQHHQQQCTSRNMTLIS